MVVAWDADAAARTAALEDATIDGIDAPGPAELDQIATLPELVVTDRAGLATAFLAFGVGPGVLGRRGPAGDRRVARPGRARHGRVPRRHDRPVAPDAVHRRWRLRGPRLVRVQRPGRRRVARDRGVRPRADLPAPRPRRPGPRPAGSRRRRGGREGAARDEPRRRRSRWTSCPPPTFRDGRGRRDRSTASISTACESPLADAAGLPRAAVRRGRASRRPRGARPGVSAALERAAAETDAGDRAAIIGEANTAIRDAAVVVPLAHPGSTVTFRSDVAGVVTSPLGLDPLGAATPGDRPQLVFEQATEPAGAWCGDQSTLDAFRLCGLLADGLYGFAPGGVTPEPRLARSCKPDDDARVWTCTLEGDVTFDDGTALDAGDVLGERRGCLGRDRTRSGRPRPRAPSRPGTRCSADPSRRAAEAPRRRGALLEQDPLHQDRLLDERPDLPARLGIGRRAGAPAAGLRRPAQPRPWRRSRRGCPSRRPACPAARRRTPWRPRRSPGGPGSGRPGPASSRAAGRARRRRPTSPRGPRSRPLPRGRRRPSGSPRRPCRGGRPPRPRRRATGWGSGRSPPMRRARTAGSASDGEDDGAPLDVAAPHAATSRATRSTSAPSGAAPGRRRAGRETGVTRPRRRPPRWPASPPRPWPRSPG